MPRRPKQPAKPKAPEPLHTCGPHTCREAGVHLTLVAEFTRVPDRAGALIAALLTDLAAHFGDPKVSGFFSPHTHRTACDPVNPDAPIREWEADPFSRMTLNKLAADPRLPAMDAGAYNGLCFHRSAGRLSTRRTQLVLHWTAPPSPPGHSANPHTLTLSLSLPDALEAGHDALMALATRFFDRAAATGVCSYALGDIADRSESAEGAYYTYGPWVNGRSRFQRLLELELWSAAGPRRTNFVRGVFWANYLSPLHMQRLGGRDAIDEFLAIAECHWGTDFGSGSVREYPDGSALFILAPINRSLFMIENVPWFQGDIMLRSARWLAIRLARARLTICFDEESIPRPTDGADHTPPALPPPPTDEEIAAYMAHMWDNPPRCIAAAAKRPTEREIAPTLLDAGRYTTMFHVAPGGKHEPLPVWGAPAADGQLASPILVGAPIHTIAPFVFDARKHGYDGEFGQSLAPARRKLRQFTCPKCDHDHFHLAAHFEYSGGNEELADPALIPRRQDFFSWFHLKGRCASCRKRVEIASVECA